MKLDPLSLRSLTESVAIGTAHGFEPTTTLLLAEVGEVTSALCIVSTGTGMVGSIEFKLLL